jgi:hypothetical protein
MFCRYRLMMVAALCILLPAAQAQAAGLPGERVRPPAVPLVTSDPYFSIWSFANDLTSDSTRHWTGTEHGLQSMVRVDGKAYRVMGPEPRDVPAMPQSSVEVLPTRTIYTFEGAGVRVTVTFTTPLLPHDLDLISRPATYLDWEVSATDGKQHDAAIYYDNNAALVVNKLDEAVVWSRQHTPAGDALCMGTKAQPILGKAGDNLRINWGYLYILPDKSGHEVIAKARVTRDAFIAGKNLPGQDDPVTPTAASDAPVMAVAFAPEEITTQPLRDGLLIAYDDIYSIEYFHQRLRAWWRRNGVTAASMIAAAWRDHDRLPGKCRKFDSDLMADLTRQGGALYAQLAALAYRQSFAAQKLVAGPKGVPYLLPKENFSNGCIGTVDVIYPAAPILLLLNPELERASLAPVLDYAASGRWHFPFAPHDLGTYPLANGQVYGGGETSEKNQMPVEESGNFLILVAALAKIEGNAAFAQKYWPQFAQWAEYLKHAGLDPANQLCTDDFAGHLPHNANLSAKAIEALGSYAMLCELTGHKSEATAYRATTQEFAQKWVTMADDGDHFRLAFDKPGTWSQDYNLVWDRLLGLNLFPPEVARKDVIFYKTRLNRFGLPLDNRKDYTKLDWEVWTATLTDSAADFEALIAPLYVWMNETPTRVPLTDWYSTTTGKKEGFQARSVVGGVYIKMLADAFMWKKWASNSPSK